ncbi:MAG: excinuclease ABC subunit UvrB [Thermoplasmatales archaeon]
MTIPLRLKSRYSPSGDQPSAISELVRYLESGVKFSTLMGITGSGKTFTIAKVLEKTQRPALILSPNKTLAAQLFSEFSDFFPESEVHFFISYYDYYRPEAYIPETDTYLEKEASINEEIDKMRHAATVSLLEGNTTIIVASVSAIYGIGAPQEYLSARKTLSVGTQVDRDLLCLELADKLLYKRAFDELHRGTFRMSGDTLEIVPSHDSERAYRVIFYDDTIEEIYLIDAVTKRVVQQVPTANIYPTSHFAASRAVIENAIASIKEELKQQVDYLKSLGKFLEAERLESRTLYDLALLAENGTCPGIENYSRHLTQRKPGEPPITLIDYFPPDSVVVIDESHVTVPQLRGMFHGDQSRKQVLVDHGFRLPSALDNRPLKFEEFFERVNQCIFVSATPGPYELEVSKGYYVELINRPTGILDPLIEIRPATGQVRDCVAECKKEISRGGKVLVLTITKKLAEELAVYFREQKMRARYIHCELNAFERYELLMAIKQDLIDVLIGINLLREGLDITQVSLVCILDADKEGFLRSSRSLIQIIGRAARNINGRAILYADKITEAIKEAVEETNRRRKIQIEFNAKNSITPTQLPSVELPNMFIEIQFASQKARGDPGDVAAEIKSLEEEMMKAAKEMRFEDALRLREEIKRLKSAVILK